MTAPHPQTYSMMEEEIDLREYIEVLIKRWPWIIGLSLLAAIAAFVVSTFMTPVFEAESKVIILKSKTDISFEPTIRSEIDDQSVVQSQQTLVTLAQSSDVARAALEKVNLPDAETELEIYDLIEKVEVSNSANVISIKVSDEDPTFAAQLADIWAESYEQYVNQLFNERSSTLLTEVNAQIDDAEATYRLAQQALVQFLTTNQIAILEQEVEQLKETLKINYRLLNQELTEKQKRISNQYTELSRTDLWLEKAQTLQDQLKNKSVSDSAQVGDALALISLMEGELGGRGGTAPFLLQFDTADLRDSSVTADDAADMLTIIEAHQERIEQNIQTLTTEFLATEDTLTSSVDSRELREAVEPLTIRLAQLEADLEAADATLRELTADRDLSWENYQAVQRKISEVQLDLQITDSEVRVAAHALVPEKSVSPRRLLNTAIGGALAFMFTIFGTFIVEYWQKKPEETETQPSVPGETLPSSG